MRAYGWRIAAFVTVAILLWTGLAWAVFPGGEGPSDPSLTQSTDPSKLAAAPTTSLNAVSTAVAPVEGSNDSTQHDHQTTAAPATAAPTVPPTSAPQTTAVAAAPPTSPPTPPVSAPVGPVVTGDVSQNNPVVNIGETLTFDPTSNTTMRVTGNLTVLGNLIMHPNPDVTHRIVFENRGEFIVTGSGVLDIHGTPKTAWNRTGSDPSWRGSDELIVAPISPGDYQYHSFSLGSAVPTYQGYAAEVANLTRNVIIDNPSRVMLHGLDGHAPQTIKYATISNAGIRDKLGFYALHFHLNGNATRGSIVEGVLVRDSHFRAFVPHGSHGITFRDTLAVNVVANGYWWDLRRAEGGAANDSHDIAYVRAGVIGFSSSDPPDQGRQAGFNLGDGSGNMVTDSFVAGLTSGGTSSGFQWPSNAHSVWHAENLVAHNNKGDGFFVWQNDAEPHLITDIDSYLNAGAGINQGAYANSYQWIGARLVGNGEGLRLNTRSKPAPRPRQTFQCLIIQDSPVGVVVDFSPNDNGDSTLLRNVVIHGVGKEFDVTQGALAAGQTLEARVELVDYQAPC